MTSAESALALLDTALTEGRLTAGAGQNIRRWLTEPRYAEYAAQVAQHLAAGQWRELDDVFWTIIPFGTGGRRGKMYPIGSNAINDRTIGESAQGLADYIREQHPPGAQLAAAIAYDTRHRSRHFAELCAEILAAAGFQVHFLDGYRSTPELSYAVRRKRCACGIMVTASHNPPSDNAVKAYWSTGGQILPPHDRGVIDRVMNVGEIARIPFAEGLTSGKIAYCQEEVDAGFLSELAGQALPGPRRLKVLYSPLHGVGASAVMPALAADGFTEVELYAPQATPDGDFPNVPGHVSNPENPAVFKALVEHAQAQRADLVMATDPDCDRLGAAAPLSRDPAGPWKIFTGNQIAALLSSYILERRKAAGSLSPEHYLVKTLVTTEMVRRIADSYRVRTVGDLQVGFKWIGGVIDAEGPQRFVFGCEESHGYLSGGYARDKDGAVAALLMAELAAFAKDKGQTLVERLDSLYWQFGYHVERTVSATMPGSEGMARMQELMARLRKNPPATLGGLPVSRVRDYGTQTWYAPGKAPVSLAGPPGDLLIFDLKAPEAPEGNMAAVRPSGTEPKVKFYLFGYEPAEMLADLDDTRQMLEDRLTAIERDLMALA